MITPRIKLKHIIVLVTAVTLLSLTRARPIHAEEFALVVCLPSRSVETTGELAEAVEQLRGYLSERVPGAEFKSQIFRRANDAYGFASSKDRTPIAAVFGEALFFMDYPNAARLSPIAQAVTNNRHLYRKLLVVRSDSPDLSNPASLRGMELTVPLAATEHMIPYLERVIFRGLLDPNSWFGELRRTVDDFSAVYSLLFKRTVSALVADYNPLLKSHLGDDLKVIYESPDIPMPIIAVSGNVLNDRQRDALEEALGNMRESNAGGGVLDAFALDRFSRFEEEGETIVPIDDLFRLPAQSRRRMQLATSSITNLKLPEIVTPSKADVPYLTGVRLPEIELPEASSASAH